MSKSCWARFRAADMALNKDTGRGVRVRPVHLVGAARH